MKLSSVALFLGLCSSAVSLFGEVRVLTLRQALDLALTQNPDLLLARLDQQKARYQVTVTRDPFSPKVFAGSGAAWSTGFPSSIEGSAPSIVTVKTQMAIFNRPQSYLVAQANEEERGAGVDVARRQEEVMYRVASLYLDAEQAARSLEVARRQADNLTRVRELMEQRVAEGRELAIEAKKAKLAVLRAGQRVDNLSMDLTTAESSLAQALGFGADDRARVATEERAALAMPGPEEASIAKALEGSNELKRLESNMQAKMLEIKSYRAERLPKVNLVAQYSLFAKYTYQDYFAKFQRNNAQLGASIEIPLLVGRAGQAQSLQAEQDIAKLRIEVGRTRARITGDLRVAYQNLTRAEAGRDVARADLDLTREELTIDLAQMDEGRLPLATVEALRATENEKWVAYYEAQHTAEVARLNVL
ncbi:MAG: TolC family protein, partial [Acidobacteriota bacterium]|nr:TolC family protein [Acidobacteriota bacterium]